MSTAMALRPWQATARALLPRLQQPLLLIWGAADRLVPLEVSGQCQVLQPGSELAVLPHCGHCPHDEAPDPFNRLLLRWLTRTFG
jgi:pimeloyl-ACP methyl ester carboxylesterase